MKNIRFVLSVANGANAAKVVKEVQENQLVNVIFMVASPDEAESEVVANTIAALFNGLIHKFKIDTNNLSAIIRKNDDWSELESYSFAEFYVYAYATPNDYQTWKFSEPSYKDSLSNHRIFYIGRGQNSRLNDHVSESIKDLLSGNNKNSAPFEAGKVRTIQEFLLLESESIGNQMVRKLAEFSGPYALAQYAATEYFLINHWLGVYSLENLTRGDTKIKGSSAQWLSRPKHLPGNSSSWKKLVEQFPIKGINAAKQPLAPRLIIDEINTIYKKFPLEKFGKLTSGFSIDHPQAISDGTDAFYSLTLHNSAGDKLMHLQLKLSDSKTGICLNMRPIDDDAKGALFKKRIAKMFSNAIASNGSYKPYFKPVATGDIKKRDIWFDFRNPTQLKYDISDTPLSQATGSTGNHSLYEILNMISTLANPIK